MAWETWVPTGTQTTMRVGLMANGSILGIRSTNAVAGLALSQLFEGPFVKGRMELKDGSIIPAGSAPEFPVTPKWRKRTRQIG